MCCLFLEDLTTQIEHNCLAKCPVADFETLVRSSFDFPIATVNSFHPPYSFLSIRLMNFIQLASNKCIKKLE